MSRAEPRFATMLFLAFGAVALLFVSGTLLSHTFSGEIEGRYQGVAWNALPSITHLNAANDALRDLEAIGSDYPDLPEGQRAAARAAIEQKWRSVDVELDAYLALPTYEGERELYDATAPESLRQVNASLTLMFAQVDAQRLDAARSTAAHELRAATRRASSVLREEVSLNARHATEDMNRIAAVHRGSLLRAMLLDGLAVLGAAALAIAVFRRLRAHDRLLDAHNELLQERAAELEVFAQRVAHDLLGPLSALTFCLGAFKRPAEGDPKLREALRRASACVTRAQGMVHGIFEFARAGGKPEEGARADVRELLEQARDDLLSAEGPSLPDVRIEHFEDAEVACAPGVLASVLSNLLRNAAKFMSGSDERRITVRVLDKGAALRLEVEDTGPGIPSGLEDRIFEPYVRAQGASQPGLGLGLATVRRLCEAHGGKVGVISAPGRGALFWFTLPKSVPSPESLAPQQAAAPIEHLN